MSLARTFLLFLSLALAWAAVYILETLSLAGVYPNWLLQRAPRLAYSMQWLPGDLRTTGVWLALLASLLFGLAIPTWIGISSRRLKVLFEPAGRTRRTWPLLLAVAGMLAAALILAATTPTLGASLNGWVRTVVWLGALALAGVAARLASRDRTRLVEGDDGGTPERAWPWLLVVLAAAGFLFVWENARLPATLPAQSYLVGLQAEQGRVLLAGGPLALGRAGLPWLSTLLTSVAVAVARTPIGGLAWSGLVAGLALVAATWLLGCEIFRRTKLHDGEGDILDDDGRAPALWAAFALAAALPMIHFARVPLVLEPVVLGVLGIWALVRGAREGRYGWLAASGALLGLAILSHGNGLLFVAVAVMTWLGLALLRRRWLRDELGGVGWRGLLLWGATLAVAASPALCLWACGPQSEVAGWVSGLGGWRDLFVGMGGAIEALGVPLDALPGASPALLSGSLLVAYGLTLAPLLLLGFAGMLFQVDQMVGWLGAGWLILALIAAAPLGESDLGAAMLLGALPATALAIAFALDRTRATLTRTMGGWINGSAVLLASGLVAVAALAALRAYPAAAGLLPDAPSALARAMAPAAAANRERPLVLLADGASPSWEHPALQLAVREEGELPPRLTLSASDPSSWPATLPAQARVYLLPGFRGLVPALAQKYPGGSFLVRRDVRGNPAVYIYQLP